MCFRAYCSPYPGSLRCQSALVHIPGTVLDTICMVSGALGCLLSWSRISRPLLISSDTTTPWKQHLHVFPLASTSRNGPRPDDRMANSPLPCQVPAVVLAGSMHFPQRSCDTFEVWSYPASSSASRSRNRPEPHSLTGPPPDNPSIQGYLLPIPRCPSICLHCIPAWQ